MTYIYIQIPTDVPSPDSNSAIDLNNIFDIILFIILPLIMIFFYFFLRRRSRRKEENERDSNEN